jgi:PAS domain S-box-containing protein
MMEQQQNDFVTDANVVRALEGNLAIIRFDLARQVTYVNEVFAKTMGYTAEDITGMLHREFCFPDFADSPAYEEFWNSLIAGRSFQDKIERRDAKGETVWLEATYMPVYDGTGENILEVCKIATNITVRQNHLAAVVDELKLMSTHLNTRAELGIERSKELLDSITVVAKVSSDNMAILTELQEQAQSIQGVVQTVRDIASQTQLLSLNAAIEAAHAKEFGRGFDIIAKEVRKLSNRAENSITEIRDHIQGIAKEITRISKGTEDVQNYVVRSQQEIEAAIDEFATILSSAQQLDSKARDVTRIV